MRPISLTIDGFTSFRTERTIPFTNLEVFAITGENGAGKSSILEAILFALYGQTNRLGNEKKDLVSLGYDKAAVMLEFESGEKCYRVTRSFKSKGSPFIKLERVLEEGRSQTICEGAAVTDEIEKILRMPYEAFTKAVIIPQGEFDAFLKPKSPKDRRKILIELFHLGIYERMREKASEIFKNAEAEERMFQDQLETGFPDASEDLLKDKQKEKAAAEKQKSALENKLSGLRLKAEELQTIAKLNESFVLGKEKIKDLRLKRKESSLKVKDLERLARNAKLEESRIDSLQRNIEKLKSAAREIQTLQEKTRRVEQMRKEGEAKIEQISSVEKKRTSVQSRISVLQKTIEQVNSEASKTGFQQELYNRLQHLSEPAYQLKQKESEKQQLAEDLSQTENLHATEKGKTDQVKKMLNQKSRLFESAGTKLERGKKSQEVFHLRHGLTIGGECPVCDTLLTRLPAISEKEEMEISSQIERDQAEFDSLRGACEALRTDLTKSETRCESLHERMNKIKAQMEEAGASIQRLDSKLRRELNIPENKRSFEYILESLDSQRKFQMQFNDLKNRIDQSDVELRKFRDEEQQLEIQLRVFESEQKRITQDLQALQTEIKALQDSLSSFLMGTTPEKAATTIQKEQNDQQGEITKIRETVSLSQLDLARAQENEKSLNESLEVETSAFQEIESKVSRLSPKEKKITLIDVSDMEAEIRLFGDQIQTADREIWQLESLIGQIEKAIQQYKTLQKKITELKNKKDLYAKLSRILASNNLQEFVVSTLLTQMIERANEFLRNLTQERYALDQRQDDIVVKDAWSGEESRIVRTLSGGESFVVSLALALALSDVVGGSHLGSLFLDEGFGSLDREKLELVHDALGKLTGAGKMIGVVTHMEELANRFPVRIHVRNTPNGSDITYL